jgi:hypothetical protein
MLRTVDLTNYVRLSDLMQHLERKARRKKRTTDEYKWPQLASFEDDCSLRAELAYALLHEMACKASFTGRFRCARLLISKCGRKECQTCTRGHHHPQNGETSDGVGSGRGHQIDADIPLPLPKNDLLVLLCANRRGHEVSMLEGNPLVHVKRGGFTGCHTNILTHWRQQISFVGAQLQNDETEARHVQRVEQQRERDERQVQRQRQTVTETETDSDRDGDRQGQRERESE